MKRLILIIMVLMTSIVNGQVIKIHISEIYQFSHLAVINTDKAIEIIKDYKSKSNKDWSS